MRDAVTSLLYFMTFVFGLFPKLSKVGILSDAKKEPKFLKVFPIYCFQNHLSIAVAVSFVLVKEKINQYLVIFI